MKYTVYKYHTGIIGQKVWKARKAGKLMESHRKGKHSCWRAKIVEQMIIIIPVVVVVFIHHKLYYIWIPGYTYAKCKMKNMKTAI